MPALGRRMTRVYNKTCQVVELQVKVPHADGPRKTIRIGPNKHIDVKSTEFNYDDVNPQMPATIKVFLGGSSANKVLMPSDFVHYSNIVIQSSDDEHHVSVTGIKAEATDIGRIRGLGHIAGRDYLGKEGEMEEGTWEILDRQTHGVIIDIAADSWSFCRSHVVFVPYIVGQGRRGAVNLFLPAISSSCTKQYVHYSCQIIFAGTGDTVIVTQKDGFLKSKSCPCFCLGQYSWKPIR